MEYFDTYNAAYVATIKSYRRRYLIRLELLNDYEGVIGEITKDLSLVNEGQITVNKEQITRRSLSLTMRNVEKKYIPTVNSPFWLNRKFKMWIGVSNGTDVYWWSYGVYYTQAATADRNNLMITAIDKGGALDGTLGVNMLSTQYIIKPNTTIFNVVRDTLMYNSAEELRNIDVSNIGNIKPIDPIEPIIDNYYRNIRTQSEITVDSNNYIGDLFAAIADGYGANIYYNTNGHMVLSTAGDANKPDGYAFMAHQWDFADSDSNYIEANFEYDFSGRNAVTVYTNISGVGVANVSYTAYNTSPVSPLRVSLVGVRALESQEIKYVDVTPQEMVDKCRQYADYLLTSESIKGMTVTFNSPIIPHLDVGKTIGITDRSKNIYNESFVIQSISTPLSSNAMTITASNVAWLPNYKSAGGGEIVEQTSGTD